MTEGLFLSQTDSRPMYLQIIDQVKLKILAGDWPPGHPLPSIRELAAATKVSVITVKRAYAELEKEGVLVTWPGRGSFVSDDAALQSSLRHAKLDEHVCSLLNAGEQLGLGDGDLVDYVRKAINKRNRTRGSSDAECYSHVASNKKI